MSKSPLTQITSKDLKNFLDANKVERRLLTAVERHLMTRPVPLRRADILHPSEIIDPKWCHRDAYYRLKQARAGIEVPQQRHRLRMESIFAEGHTIHEKWQTWFKEMGVLYGMWRDTSFYEKEPDSWGLSSAVDSCMEYAEVPLHSKKYVMEGHADGWIIGLGADCLIELKSIGTGTLRFSAPGLLAKNDDRLDAAFKDIRAPFRSHLLQGTVYLRLCQEMEAEGLLPRPAPKEIVFLYENKSNQDYKEFVVQYESSLVDGIFDAAHDIAWGLDNNHPPRCNLSQKANGRCSKCKDWNDE